MGKRGNQKEDKNVLWNVCKLKWNIRICGWSFSGERKGLVSII